jgi:hypothetical protein
MNQEQLTGTTDEFFNDIGTFLTSRHVRETIAIGGKADVARIGQN